MPAGDPAASRTRCEPGLEHAAGPLDSLHELERRRRGQPAIEIESLAEHGEVDVTVDEPREEGQARSVDLLRVGGYRDQVSSTGRLDMSGFDEDDGFPNCFAGRRIQQAIGMESPNHAVDCRGSGSVAIQVRVLQTAWLQGWSRNLQRSHAGWEPEANLIPLSAPTRHRGWSFSDRARSSSVRAQWRSQQRHAIFFEERSNDLSIWLGAP